MTADTLSYVLHGICELPIDTDIYAGCIAFPNCTMHVRRNPGRVTIGHLRQMGIEIDPQLKLERVEIIGNRSFANYHDPVATLSSSGFQRIDFIHTSFHRLRELYQEAISDDGISCLYSACPRNDPRESDASEIALTLHLAQDHDHIEDLLHRIAVEDIIQAVSSNR